MLQMQKSDSENILKMARTDYKTTAQQLEWYSGLREESAKFGIPVEDVSQLVKVVNGVRALGHGAV
jgi:hypothetical protein